MLTIVLYDIGSVKLLMISAITSIDTFALFINTLIVMLLFLKMTSLPCSVYCIMICNMMIICKHSATLYLIKSQLYSFCVYDVSNKGGESESSYLITVVFQHKGMPLILYLKYVFNMQMFIFARDS